MMRVARTFSVLGFGSTHDALDAEQLLLGLGFDVVPIPTPKTLGSLCGISLRLEPQDEGRALERLERAGIAIQAHGVIQDV
jgi:hypothetical protein